MRQSGFVLDLVIKHAGVFTLREAARQSGVSISAAFDGCDRISGGGGVNRNPTPGVGRHVLNSSTTAACRICRCFWAFQNQSTITSLSDPRGDHTFARALILLAGLELPCDAARLQPRPSTKRGERHGGIASGPTVATGLLLVGGEPGAGLPRPAHVCRGLPRPTWASPPEHMPRTSLC